MSNQPTIKPNQQFYGNTDQCFETAYKMIDAVEFWFGDPGMDHDLVDTQELKRLTAEVSDRLESIESYGVDSLNRPKYYLLDIVELQCAMNILEGMLEANDIV